MTNSEVPDPAVILERYAAVTGTDFFAACPSPPDAELVYGMLPQRLDDTMVMATSGGRPMAGAPIGHYDPVADKWCFPQEYVRPNEQPPLANMVQGTLYPMVRRDLVPGVVAAGVEVFDPQHSLTRGVRSEVAKILTPLNPISWLGRSGVRQQLVDNGAEKGAFVAADDFTTTHPGIYAANFEYTHATGDALDTMIKTEKITLPGGSLVLSFAGVQAESGSGGTVRTTRGLTLACRNPLSPQEVWIPNFEAITPAEWESLRGLPQIIRLAAKQNRQFSPSHCGVVYNLDSNKNEQA